MNAWCVVDDVEYELDCIIYATGFEVSPDHVRRGGFELYGREGVSLTEHWADGMRTLHGMQTRGFPNLFLIQNSQAAHRELRAPDRRVCDSHRLHRRALP